MRMLIRAQRASRLHAELAEPCLYVRRGRAVDYPARLERRGGGARNAERRLGLAHAAAAGGRKGYHGLARKVMALEERVDDPRRDIPPYRKTDEHRLVIPHVLRQSGNGRAGSRVIHFHRGTAFLISPIQVRFCVGYKGLYFKKIRPRTLRQYLCRPCGHSAAGEICDQYLFIQFLLPPFMFLFNFILAQIFVERSVYKKITFTIKISYVLFSVVFHIYIGEI